MIVDLDTVLPIDKIKFTGAVDRVEYVVNLFVPVAVGLKIQQVQKINAEEETDESMLDLQMETLSAMFSVQYPNMTPDWVKENVSLPYQNYIYLRIVEELSKGNDSKKIAEMVKPK